jgi:hypothetical protein
VACHRWREIESVNPAAASVPPNPRLARLQSAFAAAPVI